MLKKIVLGGALVLMSGLLVASTAVVPSPGPSSSGAPVIALVNEDEPASFNGSAYNFGSELVSMVANDDRYTWEVVSRSVAEKASADKAVNAVIMLPRSFSHDILTLQDLDPVTAVIDYRVVAGDQLSYERLQNEVFSVLRDFNTRVVKMYFASVAANISGAQVNMDSVVGAQSRLVDALSSSLHPPLAKVGTGQASEIGMAEILRAMNSAWVTAQNSFTETTTSTLDSTSSALDREQPELADYFALQEQIARTNIANGNGGIAAQAESDKRFDDDRFSQHIGSLLSGDGTWSGLAGLSSTDGTGAASGVLATLAGTVAAYDQVAVDYNSRVAGLTAALDGQRTALEGSLHDLERLETRLLQEYFGDDTPVTDAHYDDFGPTRLNSGMARTALAEKLADTFSGGGPVATTVGKYEQTVRDLVATIATDPDQYSGLFQTLTAADATFDPTPYIAQLEVIQRYDQAQGITPPQLSIPDAPSNGRQEVVTASLPVTVEAGESDVVSVALPDILPTGKVTLSVEPVAPCGSLPPGSTWRSRN